MNKIFISAAISLAALATAHAADLGPPAAAPMYTKAPPAAYSWTGFYVGGNAGAAWGSFDPISSTAPCTVAFFCYFATTSIPAINAVGAQSISPSGFTGGFEAGYNWQASNIVFGVEGDIEAFSLKGSATAGPVVYPCCAPTTFTINSSASTNWLATARGRLGFAANNWLFYATGGAAFTDLKANFNFSDTFGAANESASISGTRVGAVVGGGVEVGFWTHWSVKAEYLYVDFGKVSVTSTNLVAQGVAWPNNPFTHSVDLKANIARAGLNYRF